MRFNHKRSTLKRVSLHLWVFNAKLLETLFFYFGKFLELARRPVITMLSCLVWREKNDLLFIYLCNLYLIFDHLQGRKFVRKGKLEGWDPEIQLVPAGEPKEMLVGWGVG